MESEGLDVWEVGLSCVGAAAAGGASGMPRHRARHRSSGQLGSPGVPPTSANPMLPTGIQDASCASTSSIQQDGQWHTGQATRSRSPKAARAEPWHGRKRRRCDKGEVSCPGKATPCCPSRTGEEQLGRSPACSWKRGCAATRSRPHASFSCVLAYGHLVTQHLPSDRERVHVAWKIEQRLRYA